MSRSNVSKNFCNKNNYEIDNGKYRSSGPCIKRQSRKNYDACARFASLKSPTRLTSLKACGTSRQNYVHILFTLVPTHLWDHRTALIDPCVEHSADHEDKLKSEETTIYIYVYKINSAFRALAFVEQTFPKCV